jgi:glutathione synthase/RimK-type ligase-like ATP-grasp enzyme
MSVRRGCGQECLPLVKLCFMTELNSERALVSILRGICAERGIKLTAFSADWIFCLQTSRRTGYVFGYDFTLNSASAKMISKDKAATSDLLSFHGVPRVEHRIFHGPQLVGYVPTTGNWSALLEYFACCGRDVVCKPNEGTGGRGVFRARTPLDLELAVHRLFTSSRSICVSPFEPFAGEYRVAVMNGRAEFVYRKRRRHVVGDGRRTLLRLLLDQLNDSSDLASQLSFLAGLPECDLDFNSVPSAGITVDLNWRHNLGQGAAPELLDARTERATQIAELAIRAMEVLGIALASVDVVEASGKFKVLEINSGIMMESFVRSLPEGRDIARRFYEKIICSMLDLQP